MTGFISDTHKLNVWCHKATSVTRLPELRVSGFPSLGDI